MQRWNAVLSETGRPSRAGSRFVLPFARQNKGQKSKVGKDVGSVAQEGRAERRWRRMGEVKTVQALRCGGAKGWPGRLRDDADLA
jgi:hypothetical protein